MITPIRGRKQLKMKIGSIEVGIRNDNPDKGTETHKMNDFYLEVLND